MKVYRFQLERIVAEVSKLNDFTAHVNTLNAPSTSKYTIMCSAAARAAGLFYLAARRDMRHIR